MKDCFRTRDLSTAALELATDGIHFEGLESFDQRSKYFLFSPKLKAERLAMDFIAGRVTINARLYADAMKRAKDVLFDSERQMIRL